MITHQQRKQRKQLRKQQATSQYHTQTVKIYRGHDEKSTIYSDNYTFIATKEPTVPEGAASYDHSLGSLFSEDYDSLSRVGPEYS